MFPKRKWLADCAELANKPFKDLFTCKGDQMKDPYNATSLEEGDDLAYTIKLHIGHVGTDGVLYIAVYKCRYENPEIGSDGSPQGDKINPPIDLVKAIFPILSNYEVAYY